MALRPRVPSTGCLCQCPKIHRTYATVAVTVPSVPLSDMHAQTQPIIRIPPGAPESFKPAFLRKTQLHRQYTSLLRSTPLMLLFQHNNMKASEWVALRRELSLALHAASASSTSPILPGMPDPASSVRLQSIRSGIFGAALRVVEFYNPEPTSAELSHDPTVPLQHQDGRPAQEYHALSKEAYIATLHPKNTRLNSAHNRDKKWKFSYSPRAHLKKNTPLHRLLHGPIAVLSFPGVTPQHLAAALSILAPTQGSGSAFPAPRRKAQPSYYDGDVQAALGKLLLLGARVEGRTMDGEGVRWVGGLAKSGGLEGLRAHLVSLLQGVGGGITSALESAGRNLWVTMEGRRVQMEDGEKGENGEAKEGGEEKTGSG